MPLMVATIYLQSDQSLVDTAISLAEALQVRKCERRESDHYGGEYFLLEGFGLRGHLYLNTEGQWDNELAKFACIFDVDFSFVSTDLDTFTIADTIAQYYAQFIAFQLGIETCIVLPFEKTSGEIEYVRKVYKRNPAYDKTRPMEELVDLEPVVIEKVVVDPTEK